MKVMVAAGGSGGHIFPALSFLAALKIKDASIDSLLVLPRRSLKNRFALEGCNVKYISVTPVSLRSGLRVFADLFNLLKGFFQSFFVLIEYKPDVVVGFGGIESVPAVMIAWLFRIKTVIHEQNVIPGNANRVLAKFADKAAVSFQKTGSYLGIRPGKIVFTGNPIRSDMKSMDRQAALKFFGLEEGKFTVLIMGGSMGSHRINSVLPKALLNIGQPQKFQAIHIAGMKDYPELEREYSVSAVKVKLFDFLGPMQYAYSIADLAIVRAGATTIAELAAFKLPAILVPYPYAQEHQAANAEVLRSAGCAVVVRDEELDVDKATKLISGLMSDSYALSAMRAAYGGMPCVNSAGLLADEVLAL